MTFAEKARTPAQVRMNEILKRLHEGGSVTVAKIAQDFGISDMTVRRDLTELEREGLLERVHGGAVPPAGGPLQVIDDVEPTFKARLSHNADIKGRIAARAVEVLSSYRTIAMDVGTSTLITARRMAATPGMLVRKRVFTNGLRIAETLAETEAEVYVPGGRIRADEMSMTGPVAVEQFSQFYFDVVVLGTSGLTNEGFFDYSLEEIEMKRVYIERSAKRIVLCDSSKFRRMSTARVAALQAASMIITDAAPPVDIASTLAAASVDVQITGL
ncbi:DeoR family transcriptional regulator [Breoghania corrubedonensis]|uniref:DeoR family transcriptional regulator n=1 Tax=Breoghania corrubedonensis TaxID=665038 RepID=A0A2T5V8Z5_9HYPH|nr:DeoR/GlpR family DNA-binding transcription regulator [Breoghania corrubedonensis]PTW60227.1 DeoR family transcriptional regulator [Breoghania corrubedonensis]